jgi:hypothetical protein
MRIIGLVAALVFVVMAVIQFNDPDPLYWVAVYTGTAWVGASRAIGRASNSLTLIVLGLICAGLLIAAPGFSAYLRAGDFASIGGEMAGASTPVESAREFLGLVLALAFVVYVLIRTRKHA